MNYGASRLFVQFPEKTGIYRRMTFVVMMSIACAFTRGSAVRETMSSQAAISAIVTGNDQQVGFRAMVMKQAIEYNLAGTARNDANQIVHFTLQGDKHRIDSALATVQEGTKRSSDIKITTTPASVDPALAAFTIVDWTSSSRNITNKYNLVFKLRADDTAISATDVKAEWHRILEKTLDADDLKKLQPDD